MPNRELRKLWRDIRAAVAAVLVSVALFGIGFWAAAGGNPDARTPIASGGLCVTLLSPLIGVMGAEVRSLNRAGVIGAGLVGLPAAVVLLAIRENIGESLWAFAAFCSFGSVIAQVGAASAATSEDSSSRKGQFTLRQLMFFFLPVALFLGYIVHFSNR
jgi:hypothetical protein